LARAGPTAVAYTLYFRGLRTFVLGQRLSAAGIAGAVTLVAAVLVTVRDATPQTPQPGP
jgi:hypothetical protein